MRKLARFTVSVLCASIVLAMVACIGGGGDNDTSTTATAVSATTLAPNDPFAVLHASSDALAHQNSFILREVIDLGGAAEGRLELESGYQQRDISYYVMNVDGDSPGGETQFDTYMLLLPDLYVHTADGAWYVQTPWNQGIKPSELLDPAESDPINQYEALFAEASKFAKQADDVIEGKTYLRFGRSEASDTLTIWIDAETLLPFKVEASRTESSAFENGPSSTTNVEITYSGYNEEQAPPSPPPPQVTRPIRDLQLPDALCVAAEIANCALPQGDLSDVAKPTCEGTELRACIVPMGQIDAALVTDLVAYYDATYQLPVTVLSPLQVPSDLSSNPREQIDARQMIEYMTGSFPGTDGDANAVMIGLMPLDLYDSTSTFRYVFGLKYAPGYPKAVLSTFRMDPRTYGEAADSSVTERRFRTMLNKYIGLLYYELPQSDDPTSAMFNSILGVDDLDNMTQPLAVETY